MGGSHRNDNQGGSKLGLVVIGLIVGGLLLILFYQQLMGGK